MSDWITDRRPTKQEVADRDFTVVSWNGNVFTASGLVIRELGFPWIPLPAPCNPPKRTYWVDTQTLDAMETKPTNMADVIEVREV